MLATLGGHGLWRLVAIAILGWAPMPWQAMGLDQAPHDLGLFAALWLDGLRAVIAAITLGAAVSALWGRDSQRLVPGYRRRLTVMAVSLGLLVWLGLLVDLTRLPPVQAAVPGMLRFLAIALYAYVGGGFVFGFFIGRQTSWPIRLVMILLPAILFGLGPVLVFQPPSWLRHLPESWSAFQPMTVFALLVGPHNWLWFLRWHHGAPLAASDLPHAIFTNRPVGTGFDLWLWQRLQVLLLIGKRPRPEWLLLPPGLLTQIWVSLLAMLLMLVMHRMFDLPTAAISLGLCMAAVASFAVSLPLRAGLLGRWLLLPGAPHHRELPAWINRRYRAVLFLAAGLTWLPSLLAAVWAGQSWHDALVIVGAFTLSAATAAAWQVFSVARRAGPLRRTRAGLPLVIVTMVLTIACAIAWLVDAPLAIRLPVLALAVIWPVALYAYAVRHWPGVSLAAES